MTNFIGVPVSCVFFLFLSIACMTLSFGQRAMAQQAAIPDDQDWEVVDDADNDDDVEDVPIEFLEDVDSDGDGMPDSEDLDYYRAPELIPIIRLKSDNATPQLPANSDTPFSIGGAIAKDKQVPWQAQIYGPFTDSSFDEATTRGMALWQKQHVCGGSLITAEWVLTAAHCINSKMVNQFYRIRLGAEDISKEIGITYRIDRIVRHAEFTNMYQNDIALVHIAPDNRTRPTNDPGQVSAISLSARPPAHQSDVFSSGWGRVVASDRVARRGNDVAFLPDQNFPNAVLLKVDLQVISNDQCAALTGYDPVTIAGRSQPRVHSGVICAGKTGKATCRGDSGGPLFDYSGANALLVGIVSWGKGRCTGDGQPGVYTSVAYYYDWIRRAMKITDPLTSELR
jgi:secreted trypsin-like serine protease